MNWLVAEFIHETNTFSNILPGRKEFAALELLLGDEIVTKFRGTRSCPGGFIDFIERNNINATWTIAAFTTPAGRIQQDFYEWALAKLLEGIPAKVDGVLLSLHGALCTRDIDDGDADILRTVRQAVGPNVPISAVLDFHGNVGPSMLAPANILVGYKTYPHIDLHEAATQAASLLYRTVRGEIHPQIHLNHPPLLAPLGHTATSVEPLRPVMERAAAIERMPGVLGASVFGGFPYADVPDAGMSAVVVTDGNKADGPACAKELSDMLWSRRHAFLHHASSPEQAVQQAIAAPKGPIVLADIADNTGGGGAGDGVEILRELLRQSATSAAFGPVWDPAAAEACRKAGRGATVTLALGAHTDNLHGKSIQLTGQVIYLGDGQFIHRGPMFTGVLGTIGPCAVVRSGGTDVLIASERLQNLDPEMFRCAGIEPTQRKIVVVKSSIHYRAAYTPIAAQIIEVDAPGLVCPNLKRFDYRKVRRPIFPLDTM